MSLVATHALAHGEDRPGPHGGFISMPGAFHVELVPLDSRNLKAYLLDVEWKNPTLKESSIHLVWNETRSECLTRADYFLCQFPADVDLKKPGVLKVSAVREKQTGAQVTYSLPLTFKKEH